MDHFDAPVPETVPLPVRAGRPTREQAEARQQALLDCALEHFLKKGFEGTSIDAITADVRMTKRTVYTRFHDKAALFRAAVRLGTERVAVSREVIEATRREDIEETLVAIAMLRLDVVATAAANRLQRLINTESFRFPDLIGTYYEVATLPTVNFLASTLAEATVAGRLAIDDPIQAANLFMGMVVSGPARFMLAGNILTSAEIDRRVRYAVRLFLRGAETR